MCARPKPFDLGLACETSVCYELTIFCIQFFLISQYLFYETLRFFFSDIPEAPPDYLSVVGRIHDARRDSDTFCSFFKKAIRHILAMSKVIINSG